MNIKTWFTGLFSTKKPLQITSEAEYQPNVELSNIYIPAKNINDYKNEIFEFPDWLSNEEALKDEGVIFGLSETKPDEKLKIIESIFNQKSSFIDKKREELTEKIGEINLYIEKNHIELERINTLSTETANKSFVEENIFRVIIGLLISIGMSVGNYFLIDYSIANGFPINHGWISIGIFFAGMFSLFNHTSVFHLPDAKLTWKTILEEFGVPFAASLFVFAQTIAFQPVFKSIALFVFVFFLFTVSGKILLSSISRLKQEMRILKLNKDITTDKNKISIDWKIEREKIESKIESLRIEKWKILPELNQIEAELSKTTNEKEAMINVFVSEFNLAKSYRLKLNSVQIKNILGQ